MRVDIEGINYSYKNSCALEQVDLNFESSGLHFILGENGSGKSTLLKCLCGLLSPQKGKVFIDGKSVSETGVKERARIISYAPQHLSLENGIYVFDFILQGRKPWFIWRERTEDENLVFIVLEKFKISHLAFRLLGELSGGERQKVILARTFVQDTELIVLDEPTNNLDLSFQLDLFKILQEESLKSKRLIIVAVHDINMALRYSHTVTMLKKGRVISSGISRESLTEETIYKMMGVKNKIVNIDGLRFMIPLEKE